VNRVVRGNFLRIDKKWDRDERMPLEVKKFFISKNTTRYKKGREAFFDFAFCSCEKIFLNDFLM
jgi:hypothetical protein